MRCGRASLVAAAVVVVLAAYGCVSNGGGEGSVSVLQNALCNSFTSVDFSATSPHAAGDTVTITPHASCDGVETPDYQYWMQDPIGIWHMVQGYGVGPITSFAWNTSTARSGFYLFQIWVRNSATSVAYDTVWTSDPFEITGGITAQECTSFASVTLSPPTTVAAGNSVRITPVANCTPDDSAEYAYWLYKPDGHWTLLHYYDAGATSFFDWDTYGAATGSYIFQIWARRIGNTGAAEAVWTSGTYTVTAPATASCNRLTVTESVASPQAVGASVTFTASATCNPPTSTPHYAFWRSGDGGVTWTMLQDYAENSAITWNTTTATPGHYIIQVWTRDSLSTGSPEGVWTDLDYQITGASPNCSAVGLNTSLPSGQPTDTLVELTAVPTCGGTPEYIFWVADPAGNWTNLNAGYNTTNPQSWTGTQGGTYTIQVWARHVGSVEYYEAVHTTNFVLTD